MFQKTSFNSQCHSQITLSGVCVDLNKISKIGQICYLKFSKPYFFNDNCLNSALLN